MCCCASSITALSRVGAAPRLAVASARRIGQPAAPRIPHRARLWLPPVFQLESPELRFGRIAEVLINWGNAVVDVKPFLDPTDCGLVPFGFAHALLDQAGIGEFRRGGLKSGPLISILIVAISPVATAGLPCNCCSWR